MPALRSESSGSRSLRRGKPRAEFKPPPPPPITLINLLLDLPKGEPSHLAIALALLVAHGRLDQNPRKPLIVRARLDESSSVRGALAIADLALRCNILPAPPSLRLSAPHCPLLVHPPQTLPTSEVRRSAKELLKLLPPEDIPCSSPARPDRARPCWPAAFRPFSLLSRPRPWLSTASSASRAGLRSIISTVLTTARSWWPSTVPPASAWPLRSRTG